MNRFAAIVRIILIAVTVATCTSADAQSPAQGMGVAYSNGLSDADRRTFYHLAAGSELIPLSWLRALTQRDGSTPFLTNMERFGLVPDSSNADGLPIGFTAAVARDVRFMNLRMTGLNCAACHTAELTYNGKVIRIDGGPARFMGGKFQQELTSAIIDVFSSREKFWAFYRRLRAGYETQSPQWAAADARALSTFIRSALRADSAGTATPFEAELLDEANSQLDAESARDTLDLAKDLQLVQQSAMGGESELLKTRRLMPLLSVSPGAETGDAAARAYARDVLAPAALADVVNTFRLLRARLKALNSLRGEAGHGTDAGPGRVDAFGVARNRVFAPYVVPLTAPVSFPHLWGHKYNAWVHWDGNTTSITERDMGQALGTGAVFDMRTKVSTLIPKNIYTLEVLAQKITPPVWPESVLGVIDAVAAAEGERLFAAECGMCHGATVTDVRNNIFPFLGINTDSLRSTNFALPLGNGTYADAIAPWIREIKNKAFDDVRPRLTQAERRRMEHGRVPQWRVTYGYSVRPLVGAWATAPYLHNNSVPTIADLLEPVVRRPVEFPVGQMEYDPIRLGIAAVASAPFTFDTRLPGNSNSGHEYGTKLSSAEKRSLLEYLKTLK